MSSRSCDTVDSRNGKLSYRHQTSEDLALEERSHVAEEENTKVNSELKKSEQKLKQQVSNLSNQVRNIVASGYQPFHDQHGRGPCENGKKTVAIHWHGLKPKDTRLQRWRAFYNKSMRLCWSAIQRVQNQWLWMKYFSSKLRLQCKNKGFDFQFSKPENHWGTGVYFTETAEFLEQYTHLTGQPNAEASFNCKCYCWSNVCHLTDH